MDIGNKYRTINHAKFCTKIGLFNTSRQDRVFFSVTLNIYHVITSFVFITSKYFISGAQYFKITLCAFNILKKNH